MVKDKKIYVFAFFRGGGGGLAFFLQKTWGWLTRESTVHSVHSSVRSEGLPRYTRRHRPLNVEEVSEGCLLVF